MIGFVIACHLATAPKMAQKNRGPYSGTSVSLAFLMPSAVASITTSSFSFMEFSSTSICFLQELLQNFIQMGLIPSTPQLIITLGVIGAVSLLLAVYLYKKRSE